MRAWLWRQTKRTTAVLLGVVSLLFLIFSLLGDPARMLAGQQADEATLQAIRAEYQLDKPLWQQYLYYLNDLSPVGWLTSTQKASGNYAYMATGNKATGGLALKLPYLKRSLQSGRPVLSLYLERLPATLLLALTSLLFASIIGIALGSLAAHKPDSALDRGLSVLSVLGVSAPSFFMGILLLWVFGIVLAEATHLPLMGYVRQPRLLSEGSYLDLSYLVLPALTLGIRPLAILFQLTRSSTLDALASDFVRTARAKGLSTWRVALRHALPNALNPVLTAISGWFASLLAGTFFVEYIFNWPGIGLLTVDALYKSDYPLVLGCCLFTGVLFLLVNILMDLVYPLLDPRIKPGSLSS